MQRQLLVQAKKLCLEHPCYEVCARDVEGRSCAAESSDAVSWCAIGALIKVHWEQKANGGAVFKLLDDAAAQLYGDTQCGVTAWDAGNGEALFSKAIELAGE